MSELLARLKRHRPAAIQLLVATLILNLLGLASALYVIQVLNRYVTYGVSATLIALTGGVLIAIAGELAFRRLRHHLAEEILGDADHRLATGLFGLLLTARVAALVGRPAGERMELLRGVERAEAALGPATLTALADVPFSLLFLAVLGLLSPVLAAIAGGFSLVSIIVAWAGQGRSSAPVRELRATAERTHALLAATTIAADTIRQFRGGATLMARWQDATGKARATRRALAAIQHDGSTLTQAVQALMGVAMIGCGAVLVTQGALDLGALIGANLIAGRALAPLIRLVPLAQSLREAQQSLAEARRFAAIEVEPAGARTLPGWRGRLELRGLAFAPNETIRPLFSALELVIEAGGVLVITGRNGTGKSCLVRILAGLLEPTRGQVLVDGVDLRQLSLTWWRRQVSCLPQEPTFIDGTVRDSLLTAQPEASVEDLERCLAAVGLRKFLDEHPRGIEQPLAQGGLTLAPGVRRRLALARALLVDGPLFLLDEPTEGLDREGAETVYALLVELVRRGKTLVVVSHDANILRGARLLLRFDGGEPALVHGAGTGTPHVR